jgi:hypothetical protein
MLGGDGNYDDDNDEDQSLQWQKQCDNDDT